MKNENRKTRGDSSEGSEENSRNTEGDKSVSERPQESNNQSDNRETESSKNSSGTLLQNRQIQSDTLSRDLETIENNPQSGQQVRQGSNGVLREGDGVRDESEVLQRQGDKPNSGSRGKSSCIRYIDLFAGVGGFRLGIERATNLRRLQQADSTGEGGSKNIKEQRGVCNGWKSSCVLTSEIRPDSNGRGKRATDTESGEHLQRAEWGDIQSRGHKPNDKVWSNKQSKTWGNRKFKQPKDISAKCVFTSEIDKYAIQTYNKNFGENLEPNDITKQDADSIPDFDLLCGGTPCQDFSIAGKRKGLHKEDGTLTRSGLFYHFLRIAKAKKPKYILMENVKGMLSSKNKQEEYNFDNMMEAMSQLGYAIDFTILNSKYFGVPQNRERVFVLAIRLDLLDKTKVI